MSAKGRFWASVVKKTKRKKKGTHNRVATLLILGGVLPHVGATMATSAKNATVATRPRSDIVPTRGSCIVARVRAGATQCALRVCAGSVGTQEKEVVVSHQSRPTMSIIPSRVKLVARAVMSSARLLLSLAAQDWFRESLLCAHDTRCERDRPEALCEMGGDAALGDAGAWYHSRFFSVFFSTSLFNGKRKTVWANQVFFRGFLKKARFKKTKKTLPPADRP